MKDTIYREDALDAIRKLTSIVGGSYISKGDMQSILMQLPSAEPEYKEVQDWKTDFKGFIDALDIPRDDYRGIMEYIDEVPSAEPKTGKWIRDKKTERKKQLMFHKVWTCSRCGEQQCRPKPSKFCPNCGSKMEGNNETT